MVVGECDGCVADQVHRTGAGAAFGFGAVGGGLSLGLIPSWCDMRANTHTRTYGRVSGPGDG